MKNIIATITAPQFHRGVTHPEAKQEITTEMQLFAAIAVMIPVVLLLMSGSKKKGRRYRR